MFPCGGTSRFHCFARVAHAKQRVQNALFRPAKPNVVSGDCVMKVLAVFDERNYELQWKRLQRSAARAVIVQNGTIALVRSIKEGYYKFPGGGIEQGETHLQALARETLEETGLNIRMDSVGEIGIIREVRKSVFEDAVIFDQTSYYYSASVDDTLSPVSLDAYEAESGYTLEWTDIRTAYETNTFLGGKYKTKFILREAFVLGALLWIS